MAIHKKREEKYMKKKGRCVSSVISFMWFSHFVYVAPPQERLPFLFFYFIYKFRNGYVAYLSDYWILMFHVYSDQSLVCN